MKVKLTGTGSIWTEQNGASVLLDDHIMIDFPGGLSKELRRMGADPFVIDSVLVTHMHGDHILEVPVWALDRVKHGAAEKASRIYATAEQAKGLRKLMVFTFGETLNEEAIDRHFEFITDDRFSVGEYNVERIPVCHGDLPSYGYILRDGTHTVSVSGDTGLCAGLLRMAECSDLFICEVSLPEGTEKHMGVPEVLRLSKEYPQLKIITTHMGDASRKLLEKENVGNLTPGTDGMECFI